MAAVKVHALSFAVTLCSTLKVRQRSVKAVKTSAALRAGAAAKLLQA
jgi:hypothetical protein